MKKAIIISGYAGVGKTYTTKFINQKYPELTVLDSDSSKFSWEYDNNGNKVSTVDDLGIVRYKRNKNFPKNYIDYIKANIGTTDLIFVSSHSSVTDSFIEEGIKFYSVIPDTSDDMKDDMMNRFKQRGNTMSFVELQSKNYINWISDIMNKGEESNNKIITLKPGEFILDYINISSNKITILK